MMTDTDIDYAYKLVQKAKDNDDEELAYFLKSALEDRAELLTRRDELLALCAKLTRETPYAGELDECRSERAVLIAEVGTLRALVNELRASPQIDLIDRDIGYQCFLAMLTKDPTISEVTRTNLKQWLDHVAR